MHTPLLPPPYSSFLSRSSDSLSSNSPLTAPASKSAPVARVLAPQGNKTHKAAQVQLKRVHPRPEARSITNWREPAAPQHRPQHPPKPQPQSPAHQRKYWKHEQPKGCPSREDFKEPTVAKNP